MWTQQAVVDSHLVKALTVLLLLYLPLTMAVSWRRRVTKEAWLLLTLASLLNSGTLTAKCVPSWTAARRSTLTRLSPVALTARSLPSWPRWLEIS